MELQENLMRRVAFGDTLRRSAVRYPDKTALIDRVYGKRLTYREFNDHANQLGHALLSLGLEKGDKVSVAVGNCAELLISYYGIAKAGMVFVVFNPEMTANDLKFQITHADSKALIVEEEFIPKILEIKQDLGEIRHFIGIRRNGSIPEDFLDFDELLAKNSSEEVEVYIDDRDPVQILYTGGTTALPRAAEHTHIDMVINGANTALDFKIDHHTIFLSALPIFHLAGFNQLMAAIILVGGTDVILRRFDVPKVLKAIEEEKVTGIYALSPMISAIINYPDFKKYDISSLKLTIYFGAVMPDYLLKEGIEKLCPEFGLEYGQTEAGDGTTFKPEDQLRKIGSMGNSGTFVELRIMDDNGNLLPPGEPGEIVYRSPFIMSRLYGDEKGTQEAFKYGWFHSGDIGYMDEEGYFYFLDRKKDLIKSGGENVTSAEVEKVIYEDDRVQEVHVVGLPHEVWAEAVTAFIIPKPGAEITKEEVISHCKQRLAGYKVPKEAIFVSEFPRSMTGKTLKFELRQQYRDLYKDAMR